MFLLLLRNQRLFSSFSCSAIEQVCGSQEAAQPGSQPKLASANIPHHRCHAQFMNRGSLGGRGEGRNLLLSFLQVQTLSCAGVATINSFLSEWA